MKWKPLAVVVATYKRAGYNPDRPGKPMQDRCFVQELDDGAICFGVLDGHGRKGHDVVDWLQQRLPQAVARCCSSEGCGSYSAGLEEAFLGSQQALLEDTSVASRASGTTAVVAVLDKRRKVTVGNVGDSRAVLGVAGGGGAWTATALSQDTTTTMPGELQRVTAQGAHVDSLGNVFAGPVGISMTRSLGDTVMASVGVLAEPHFLRVPDIGGGDDADSGVEVPEDRPACILLASDGIWGVLSNDEAVAIIGATLNDEHGAGEGGGGDDGRARAARALENLATAAAEKWQDGLPCEVLRDDIGCVLVVL